MPTEDEVEEDLGEVGIDSDAAPGTGPADSPRRKRRRRNRNRNDAAMAGDKGKGSPPAATKRPGRHRRRSD